MMRIIVGVVSVFCVATVVTEILGAAYLWTSGRLTPQTVNDIRASLAGEQRPVSVSESDDEHQQRSLSHDDIVRKRVERVWDLHRRQQELAVIKATVKKQADELTNRREEFDRQKTVFLDELKAQTDRLQSDATEQARGILAKLPPAEAVDNLMALDLSRDVILLKGMPDRTVATLLEQFQRSNDPNVVERGRKIFEAISSGQPQQQVVENTAEQLTPDNNPKQQP